MLVSSISEICFLKAECECVKKHLETDHVPITLPFGDEKETSVQAVTGTAALWVSRG